MCKEEEGERVMEGKERELGRGEGRVGPWWVLDGVDAHHLSI